MARVVAALRDAGASGSVRTFDVSTRTALEAASVLGCPVAAIANSLVFIADGAPVLVLTSGAHRVDVTHLARCLGWSVLRRATPDEVRATTGQVIGGVAPLGHVGALESFIDEDLAQQNPIWAAAGAPNAVFSTSFAELTELSGARPVRVVPVPES